MRQWASTGRSQTTAGPRHRSSRARCVSVVLLSTFRRYAAYRWMAHRHWGTLVVASTPGLRHSWAAHMTD